MPRVENRTFGSKIRSNYDQIQIAPKSLSRNCTRHTRGVFEWAVWCCTDYLEKLCNAFSNGTNKPQ
jgi:hypothetical protein